LASLLHHHAIGTLLCSNEMNAEPGNKSHVNSNGIEVLVIRKQLTAIALHEQGPATRGLSLSLAKPGKRSSTWKIDSPAIAHWEVIEKYSRKPVSPWHRLSRQKIFFRLDPFGRVFTNHDR